MATMISHLGGLGDRNPSLAHLHPALGTDELLEEASDLPLRAGVAVELAAARALPGDPPAEAADLLVAAEAETPDQVARTLPKEI